MLRKAILLLISLFTIVNCFSQSSLSGYNDLYKYNFSIGAEYQNLTPFSDYGTDFNMYYDISAIARVPLPSLPVLYPFIQTGLIQFITPERDNMEKWAHTKWYGMLGLGYSNRFSKSFELGAEIAGGIGESIFPKLDPANVRSALSLTAFAGIRIALDPAYNMSIAIHPNVKYNYSLSPLKRFDGFVYSVGFSGSYRFGEDPDSPRAIIRSIKFSKASIPPLFAAMQSYYVKHPIGQVTISNLEKFSINDIDVSFYQAGFMDSPVKSATIDTFSAGEKKTIDLYATFNEEVFKTEGTTPLTGEVKVSYISRGKAASQTFSVSYDLYDKTALTWNDDNKVAAFITPADSALRNYASFIRQSAKNYSVNNFSETLQMGMQVFYALKEIGCIYQVDPTSPFTEAQGNPLTVDSISLPRDTLKRLTGDCDDLTVLYNSLMETVGMETAFITVPGHIYSAFNTGVPSKSYRLVNPDKNMTLSINGQLWVPVEITLIGTKSFLEAWRTGIEEFKELDKDPKKRGFYFTRKSQEIYRPIGLRETDLGLQYGSRQNIALNFKNSIENLVDLIIKDYSERAEKSGNKRSYNKLGIIAAKYERYAQAQKAFNRALSMDRNYLNPIINLGSVFFLKEEYQNALRGFHRAEEYLLKKGRQKSVTYTNVLLNISKCYYELENYENASEYFTKASSLNASLKERYSYLKKAEASARGAEAGSQTASILFAEEEE